MSESSFQLVDTDNQLSIKYKNLYYINNKFLFFTTDKSIKLPSVNKWTDSYPWTPEIKLFNSYNDLIDFININSFENIKFALLGDNLWYGNVGHALFDGLYPLFLAAIKFNLQEEPFVYLTDDWSNTKVTADEAVRLFSKTSTILNYHKINKNIIFNTLIAGTGKTGNRIINKEYTLYGKQYNALPIFKNRMMTSCGAIPDKPINKSIKIAIIDNKRYNAYEKNNIQKTIKYFQKNIDISFINWSDFNSFSDQMKFLQDLDVHITGPGTGMMYMPFLKYGSVNVNLGYMEHTQTNGERPNIKIQNTNKSDHIFPGWMEQSVCAGADYVNTIYYDRFTYNNIEYQPLIEIINKAIIIVKNKQLLYNNHNIDAKIFIEYCKKINNSDELCAYLTNLALFIELFIHEHPLATNTKIVDLNLLRNIKNKYNMNREYEIKIP